MALFAMLGGLIGGALVIATIRSKRNAQKADKVQSMGL